ncbi:MAG: DUF3857 domain-containing protein [Lentisphaeria bacterium]|nr:DUF3857 domain-containing protein [Lentisphaeria bacterium]
MKNLKFLGIIYLFFILIGVFAFDYRNYLQIDAKKYPDANAVLLHDEDRIVYQKDGSSLEVDDYYIKVITQKGVVDNRTIPIYFNEFYSEVAVLSFELIKSDGKVKKINLAENSEVVIDSSQISQNIYDAANKIMKLSVPDLEVNDIIHLCVKENNRISRIKNVYSFIKVLQSDMPIIYYELIVAGPKDCPLKKTLIKDEVKSSIEFTETASQNMIFYKWVARNVPMQIPEADSPPLYLFSQRVLGSTAENWEEISRWYYNLSLPHLEKVTPQMQEKVAELISNCNSDMEKIQAIFQFVSQQIRYMGITAETEAPGYEPHDVDITFNNRYGVCRDKAALLVAMLKMAGFESYPVLFYAGYPKDEEVANNYFNHAITAVKLNGEYILMDSTDETTKELLPAYLANNSYLVAHPEGESLKISNSIPCSDNRLEIINSGVYDSKNNELIMQSELEFNGINDIIYRNALSRWQKGYEEQYFGMILRRINPAIVLESISITPENIRDMSQKLKVILRYKVRDYLSQKSNSVNVIDELRLGDYLGAACMILGNMSLDKRKFPMELFSTAETVEKTSIDFGKTEIGELQIPEYEAIDNELLKHVKNVKFSENKLEIISEFALKKNLIYPAQYKAIKEDMKKVDSDNKKLIFYLLTNSNKNFDTKIIRDLTEYNFINNFNWEKITTKEFEVLNYASMKDNSELQIYFNPAWEKVELLSAYVVNGDKTQQISPSEINVMDQNINAPTYSNGKIFTVNFPNVQVGSKVFYQVKVTAFNHPYFATVISFGSLDYIIKKEVVFRNVSNDFTFLIDDLPKNIKVKQDGKTISFSADNLSPVIPEIGMTPAYVLFPSIWVSNKTIKDFAEELKTTINSHARVTEKIKKLTSELTNQSQTELEKVRIIRDYVAKNIRKIDLKFSRYPMIFSNPDEVLERGYASSADSAVLLLSMLKALNLADNCQILLLSEFGRINNCQNYWSKILTDRFTDILIYRPEKYDGTKLVQSGFMLNGSSQYGDISEFPKNNCDYLNTAGAEIENFGNNIHNERQKEFEITINNDNSADVEAIYSYSGAYFGEINKFYQSATNEERIRFMKSLESEIAMQAESVSRSYDADYDKGIAEIKLKVHIDNFVRKSGNFYYFELPEFIELADFIRLGSEKRSENYLLKQLNYNRSNYRIKFPTDCKYIDCNENIDFNNYSLHYVCNYASARGGNGLEVENFINASETLLSPDEYYNLLNLNKQCGKKIQKTVIFTKNSGKNLQ